MSTSINTYFENAQLSLAAYGLNLSPGMSRANYEAALRQAGMAEVQAQDFADTYSIITKGVSFN
jgi:hypothetical protein